MLLNEGKPLVNIFSITRAIRRETHNTVWKTRVERQHGSLSNVGGYGDAKRTSGPHLTLFQADVRVRL